MLPDDMPQMLQSEETFSFLSAMEAVLAFVPPVAQNRAADALQGGGITTGGTSAWMPPGCDADLRELTVVLLQLLSRLVPVLSPPSPGLKRFVAVVLLRPELLGFSPADASGTRDAHGAAKTFLEAVVQAEGSQRPSLLTPLVEALQPPLLQLARQFEIQTHAAPGEAPPIASAPSDAAMTDDLDASAAVQGVLLLLSLPQGAHQLLVPPELKKVLPSAAVALALQASRYVPKGILMEAARGKGWIRHCYPILATLPKPFEVKLHGGKTIDFLEYFSVKHAMFNE